MASVEKQKLLLSLVASNRDLMALCDGIIKPSYFDPALKKTVKFLHEYFEKYKDIPKIQTIRVETGLVLEDAGNIARSDIAYVAAEVETFCRERAVTEAIYAGPELLAKGDFGKIVSTLRDAISVGLSKDMGINYFENPEERLRQTLISEAKISTGWPEVDILLGGGLGRQELISFLANSGGGKSMTMLNLGRNLSAQGLHGVYISLEMSEGVVSKRMDSMISHVSQDNLLKEMSKVAISIEKAGTKMGTFFIKRMAENRTNIGHIRSYIQQLEQAKGFRPDFIIVDYIDIMGTTMAVSLDNLFIKDKYVTEEIRSLGFDYNCIMVSAAQLGRNAIEAEKLNQAHIQGGISKINTSDYVVGIKHTDLMRASGQILFDILKTRNSKFAGHSVMLGWDPISLLIRSANKNGLQLKKKLPVILRSEQQGDEGILGLMNT